MEWIEKKSVAQYGGADWNNFVHRESQCSLEKAKEIAEANDKIGFFFICRYPMVLPGHVFQKFGAFHAGDVIFFSGNPWLGSAPQCDVYQKKITPIKVIKAIYGVEEKFNDVTEIVQKLVDAGHDSFTVNNDTMEGDPASGQVKYFSAIYDVEGNGGFSSKSCREYDVVVLEEPS